MSDVENNSGKKINREQAKKKRGVIISILIVVIVLIVTAVLFIKRTRAGDQNDQNGVSLDTSGIMLAPVKNEIFSLTGLTETGAPAQQADGSLTHMRLGRKYAPTTQLIGKGGNWDTWGKCAGMSAEDAKTQGWQKGDVVTCAQYDARGVRIAPAIIHKCGCSVKDKCFNPKKGTCWPNGQPVATDDDDS